jgi:glycosyltransferase involved in cell wall biosynthesis
VKVSLISTCKNGAAHIEEFLGSVAAQTRAPDEIVIVDGGSSDGTLDLLRRHEGITLIEEPGAGIARGRNSAIAAATHDVIAVSDADCVLEPGWLEALLAPIAGGADVSMGFTAPMADGFIEEVFASLNVPDVEEIDPARFMPSARSIAFRREAIELVGGYPEWLPIGEDMWVNHRWRERRLDLRFAPDAVVRWRSGGPTRRNWARYFRYARGDAQAGMYPERHTLRFAAYAAIGATLASDEVWPKLLVACAAAVHARRPIVRVWRRLSDPKERLTATALVPPFLAFVDTAKMAGYLTGLVDRATRRPR